jgi:hypothetical protein
MLGDSLAHSAVLTHHDEAGIGFEKPAQTLSKEAMVIH